MRIIDLLQAAAERAEDGKVISVTAKMKNGGKPEISVEELPDFEEMTKDELEDYRDALEEELERLDAREPEDLTSDAHDEWEDDHEELEDLIDEVLDHLDEMDD